MFELSLTPEEAELANFLFANWPKRPAVWTDEVSSSQQRLFHLLENRKAIPVQRLRWFLEPTLNIGGYGKSRKQGFENNLKDGNEILRHPSFNDYLHYFIYGPRLPVQLTASYTEFVGSLMQPLTSGDVEPLQVEARRLFRTFHLDHFGAAEFHKLALELGLDDYNSRSIYDAVRSIKQA